jgi:hypothetical protein
LDISVLRLIETNELAMAIPDQYPVTEPHAPLISRQQRPIGTDFVPTERVAMRWRFRPSLAVFSAVIFFSLAPIDAATRAETAVDLELVLAVDVSGSMDEEEHILQRQGYVAAFRHPEVIDTIMSGFIGRIAVTYVEWAGPLSQVVTVPWRIIDGKDSAGAFADILADEPIAFIRGTSISGGLEFAAGLFADNGIEGTRRVIDVSGDGANNMGVPVEAARDRALARGIAINGLPLLLRPRLYFWTDGAGLDDYYRDCVIGGPGSFVIPVTKKAHLARAIRRKLLLEIAGPRARLYHADAPALRAKVDCFIGEKIRRSWDDE